MTYSARRHQRIALVLRSIEDPSEFLAIMSRFLHRHRLKLKATVLPYQLPAAVHAYREAIEAEIARQEGARADVITQAAKILLHADGDANELQKLVFDHFPDLSWDEMAMAWHEMKAMAITHRDNLTSEIEAGRIPGRKNTIQ